MKTKRPALLTLFSAAVFSAALGMPLTTHAAAHQGEHPCQAMPKSMVGGPGMNKNPCAAANPCAAKAPCAAKNPCAAQNPCAARNPCAAKNPCASKK